MCYSIRTKVSKLEKTKILLYRFARYCIEKDKGKIELAKKINRYSITENLSEEAKRGLRALLLAMILLSADYMSKLVKNRYPIAIVYLTNDEVSVLKIGFGHELPDMFLITQTHTKFGVDKELLLYPEDAKDYIINLFGTHPEAVINKIDIYMSPADKKEFYNRKIGVIWSNEECIECMRKKKLGKIDSKCKKLLENKCWKQIRHSPSPKEKVLKFKKKLEEVHNVPPNIWECIKCKKERNIGKVTTVRAKLPDHGYVKIVVTIWIKSKKSFMAR